MSLKANSPKTIVTMEEQRQKKHQFVTAHSPRAGEVVKSNFVLQSKFLLVFY